MLARLRRCLILLSLLGFACRVLVPAGFMPAMLSDGGPIRICHAGAAGAFFQAFADYRSGPAGHSELAHAGHHAGSQPAAADQDDKHSGDHAAWERCDIGAVFAYAAIAAEFQLVILELDHANQWIERRYSTPLLLPGTYRARAPPAA
jgi:hypothetical protein